MSNELATMDMGRLAESLVVKGDLSALSPSEKARVYIATCERLGLNPQTQPFQLLKLNGKEILYASRGATDQLASIHRLTRKIVEGPEVRDFGGTKLLYCKAEVTHPNGRTETSVATLPPRVDENALMKLETKAKRRATLSILGLGMLDETEIETIPARHVQQVQQVDVRYTAFDELRDTLAGCNTVREVFDADRTFCARVINETDRTQQDVMGACMDRLAELKLPLPSAAAYRRWFEISTVQELQEFLDAVLVLTDARSAVEFWRHARPGLVALSTELQTLAWRVLCDRVDQIDPPHGTRQTGRWLKSLADGWKQSTPEADEERQAIQSE